MANVERYKDREGRERYAARWREGTTPHTRQMKARRDKDGRPFTSARAAMKYAEAQEADARRGLSLVRSDETVGQYAARYVESRNYRPATRKRMQYSLKHFEATGLAKRRLVDVRHLDVQAWAKDRDQALEGSTMRRLLTDLASVFQSAMHDGLILKTPVVNIRLSERDDVERFVPLTVAQVKMLAAAMPDRYRALVLTQAGLGLRIGELLGLTVGDVDFEHGVVRIEMQRTQATPHQRTDLKTKWSKRTLPLFDHVATELEHHLRAGYSNGVDLFTTSVGTVPHAVHYGRLLGTASGKAGLPRVSSHDLRHHFATLMYGQGYTAVEVGHMLGHRDGSLVERIYGHTQADTADRARVTMNALWAS